MSNPTTFMWEPEPLVLDVEYVVDLSTTSSNLYLSSPALPHVHYTTGLNGLWAEQVYGRLPPQPVQTLQPIRLPYLLVYKHKVDPNAPLGSFENPYSSFNAPPLPRPLSSNSSPSKPVDIIEPESTNTFESLEPRPPTPPKRSLRRYSDHRQEYDACPIQFQYVRSTPSPKPATKPRNTQPISSPRNRSCGPPKLRLRPQSEGISIPHRPPPVHHYTRHVHFAPSNRSLSPPLSWPSSPTPPSSTSHSPPPSFSRSPSIPPLRHHSPPYNPPRQHYSSPTPSSRSSTSYTVRSYKWPLCMLCATRPARIEEEETRFCRTCWEEATKAEGKMKRGRWWRDV